MGLQGAQSVIYDDAIKELGKVGERALQHAQEQGMSASKTKSYLKWVLDPAGQSIYSKANAKSVAITGEELKKKTAFASPKTGNSEVSNLKRNLNARYAETGGKVTQNTVSKLAAASPKASQNMIKGMNGALNAAQEATPAIENTGGAIARQTTSRLALPGVGESTGSQLTSAAVQNTGSQASTALQTTSSQTSTALQATGGKVTSGTAMKPTLRERIASRFMNFKTWFKGTKIGGKVTSAWTKFTGTKVGGIVSKVGSGVGKAVGGIAKAAMAHPVVAAVVIVGAITTKWVRGKIDAQTAEYKADAAQNDANIEQLKADIAFLQKIKYNADGDNA